MSEIRSRLSWGIVIPVFCGYLILYILGMHYHELWLDESQHFLIGRDSDSLSSMYYNMRYDGHPRLWNGLIWLITHYINPSYIGMQVLHVCIASVTTVVFLRYAPFSLLLKILILSGYYFVFEYSILSRNYAMGIMLLFILCVLLADPRKNLLLIGGLLGLICNTHLFFAFAAVGIFFYLALEFGRKEWFTGRWLLFTGLFLTGFILVILQTRTPQEESFHVAHPDQWLSGKNWSFAAYSLIRGWLPIPQVRDGHFWNTYWLNGQHIGGWLRNLLFLFFLVFPGVLLRGDKKALIFYYTALSFLIAFFVVTQDTASRYFGMAYIYFLAALWMVGGLAVSKFWTGALYTILGIQIGVGLIALQQDYTRPFSQSKNTVEYLKQQHLADQTIVMDGYNGGPMISAYLGRRVYYIATGAEGSYLTWKKRYWPTPRPSLSEEINGSAYLQNLNSYILISNRKLDTATIRAGSRSFAVRAEKDFVNSIAQESYYVYQVHSF